MLHGFDMILYVFWGKMIFFVVFGSFSITFDIDDPGILIFIFKRSILLQRKNLEACDLTIYHTFYFFLNSKFRIFGRNLERSAGIWTFGRNDERLTGISNDRSEFRTSDRNFKSSDRISNVRPESRTFGQTCWKNNVLAGYAWSCLAAVVL